MKSLPERLNEWLEGVLSQRPDETASHREQGSMPPEEAELHDLVRIAHRISTASETRVDQTFAHRLERRLLVHHLQKTQHARRAPRLFWRTPVLVVASLCMLIVVLSSGMLIAGAQTTDPTSPFYAVGRWEQQVHLSTTTSPLEQAELHEQLAHEQLVLLPSLVAAKQFSAYQQALSDFDDHYEAMTALLPSIPAGTDHDRLLQEHSTLQTEAQGTLFHVLPQLPISQRVVTTHTLAQLGVTTPSIQQVSVTWSSPAKTSAVVKVMGLHLQPGARLLINTQVLPLSGQVDGDTVTFTVNEVGTNAIEAIGIVNPDETTDTTTTITFAVAAHNPVENKKNNGSTHSGSGSGQNTGKSTAAGSNHH
jgi:hypothetical protein